MGCKDPDFSSDCYSLTEEWPRINKAIFKYNVIFLIDQQDEEKKTAIVHEQTYGTLYNPLSSVRLSFLWLLDRATLPTPLRCIALAVITMESHWLLTSLKNNHLFEEISNLQTSVSECCFSVNTNRRKQLLRLLGMNSIWRYIRFPCTILILGFCYINACKKACFSPWVFRFSFHSPR